MDRSDTKKKEPFPKDRYSDVKSLMTEEDTKSQAIYAIIEFIHWSGCRPSEAVLILDQYKDPQTSEVRQCLRKVTQDDLKGAKYADEAKYIAHLYPCQTK